jgi:hypothetical protein
MGVKPLKQSYLGFVRVTKLIQWQYKLQPRPAENANTEAGNT